MEKIFISSTGISFVHKSVLILSFVAIPNRKYNQLLASSAVTATIFCRPKIVFLALYFHLIQLETFQVCIFDIFLVYILTSKKKNFLLFFLFINSLIVNIIILHIRPLFFANQSKWHLLVSMIIIYFFK